MDVHDSNGVVTGLRTRWANLPATWRRWLLASVVLLVCANIGLLLATLLLPSKKTAEVRLVVGDQSISAQSIPGYSVATRQLAATYSRLIMSDAVAQQTGPAVDSVSASQIADSSIIRVQATAESDASAVQGADRAADALIQVVDSTRGAERAQAGAERYKLARGSVEAAERALRDGELRLRQAGSSASPALAREVSEKRSDLGIRQMQVQALGLAYMDAVKAEIQGNASLKVTQRAAITGSESAKTSQMGLLAGLMLGAAILASSSIRNTRQRNRTGVTSSHVAVAE